MPHHFRKTPSSRRAAKPTASWLVPGPSIASEIKYGRRTTHLIPVKPSHHRRRFHEGQRLSVKGYVGGPTECHVTVTSAKRVQLRDLDYPVARELGYVRVDDFQDAWVAEHDQGEYAESCILERFERRHAHREVWLLRFAVDRAETPRLLADGGREAVSYREGPDGRWQCVHRPEDAEADRGYTSVDSLSVRDAGRALKDDEWELHIGRPARDREHDRQAMLHADRLAQGTEQRLRRARDAAHTKGLDMERDFRLYHRLTLHERCEQALRQLELIESRVFPRRAAA